jgi:hypothetical protein
MGGVFPPVQAGEKISLFSETVKLAKIPIGYFRVSYKNGSLAVVSLKDVCA